jgi:hypothetical protein
MTIGYQQYRITKRLKINLFTPFRRSGSKLNLAVPGSGSLLPSGQGRGKQGTEGQLCGINSSELDKVKINEGSLLTTDIHKIN